MKHIWKSARWPVFDYGHAQIEPLLAKAMASVGEVAGLRTGLAAGDAEQVARTELVQEVMASFGIEGVALDPRQVEESVVASMKHREAGAFGRRSDAIVALIRAAREARSDLTKEVLFDWHRLLFHGIEVEDLGRWRSFPIEIVRTATAGAHDVVYMAPPPERVPAEMDQLIVWLAEGRAQPAAIRAAIAHLWFESIHPFSDGNGRIGRALIEWCFAQEHALPFSLSRQIERDKKAYYEALQAGRKEGRDAIDATAFVDWFLRALSAAAYSARKEILFLVERNRFLERFADVLNERQKGVMLALFSQGADRVSQGINARAYRKIAKTSEATASRDLAAMAQSGVLCRSEAGGRSTNYAIQFPAKRLV